MKVFTEPVAKAMIIAGLLLFLAVPFFFLWNEKENLSISSTINADKFSSYGSMLSGLVGTIWSLAGVFLFYVALREQRDDMKVNKDNLVVQTEALQQQVREFELQRVELEETRKVYEEQSKTQGLQRFENTFFRMVSLHVSIVNAIRLPDSSISGRASFRALNDNVKRYFKQRSDTNAIEHYSDLFHGNQESFSHYFRNLYHILKFIDRTDIEDKDFYAGLFRAQLSAHELSIIFYFGLTTPGKDIKILIERFEIFKDVNTGNVHVGNNEVFRKYNSKAYGKVNYDFIEYGNTTFGEI